MRIAISLTKYLRGENGEVKEMKTTSAPRNVKITYEAPFAFEKLKRILASDDIL